jgi:hypothetical protein
LAKPRTNSTDWYEKVKESLSKGPKKPVEIEKDLEQKVRQQYEVRYNIPEEVKSKQIKKETIKLRYIQDILHDLQDKGIVAQEKPFGKYFLTDKIFQDPKFTASIFGRKAISKINNWKALIQNPFVKVDYNSSDSDYSDAYLLFAFANKVGALTVYAMLDAMNPDNMKHFTKGIDKDHFVRDTINNVISPQKILWEFCKMKPVRRGQAVYNPLPISKSLPPEVQSELLADQHKARWFDPHNPAWSQYEMDRESFEKAMQAFRRVYPRVFEELEKTKNDLPNTIQWHRKSFVRSVKKVRNMRKQK